MAEQNVKKRIFISACEPSADVHCANLIKAVNSCTEAVEWVGVGGPQMAGAGCELLENTVQRAAMMYKAFGQVGFYIRLLGRIKDYFKTNKIDLVVVCDSPSFHFHVAKAAKKAGIKVLWYVAPQLWAWAKWRIRKLKARCDRLACILPFEKEWFGSRNVDAEFVGNPLFDDLSINIADSYKTYDNFDCASATLALLPGSRKAELETLWPAMQKIAIRIKDKWPGVKLVVSAASSEHLNLLKAAELDGVECEYVISDVAAAARRADFAMVASGSATLQVAAAGCPMVIMYQSSILLWHLVGRWLIKTRYLSLVNILAGRELVREFMPYFTSIEPIYQASVKLLSDTNTLRQMSADLVDLVKPLAKDKASDKLAQMVAELTHLGRFHEK